MKYRLVQEVDGRLVGTDFTAENVIPAFEVRGFVLSGTNTNKANRAELQGQPTFAGLCGPMWDGDRGGEGVIRYECQAAYRTLSA